MLDQSEVLWTPGKLTGQSDLHVYQFHRVSKVLNPLMAMSAAHSMSAASRLESNLWVFHSRVDLNKKRCFCVKWEVRHIVSDIGVTP